jgi:hypothetical protein
MYSEVCLGTCFHNAIVLHGSLTKITLYKKGNDEDKLFKNLTVRMKNKIIFQIIKTSSRSAIAE